MEGFLNCGKRKLNQLSSFDSASWVFFQVYLEFSHFIFHFFQFEDVSLNSCLWLLERAQLATGARANPLRVTRCISAMVKSLLFCCTVNSYYFRRYRILASTYASGRSHTTRLSLSLQRQYHGTTSFPGSPFYPLLVALLPTEGGKKKGPQNEDAPCNTMVRSKHQF